MEAGVGTLFSTRKMAPRFSTEVRVVCRVRPRLRSVGTRTAGSEEVGAAAALEEVAVDGLVNLSDCDSP